MSLALSPGVDLSDHSRRRRFSPSEALPDTEAEVDRLLVAGITVERDGDHYRIVDAVESSGELEALARRTVGLCICGTTLSEVDGKAYCRRCDVR
jgi:hypothetical protein